MTFNAGDTVRILSDVDNQPVGSGTVVRINQDWLDDDV